MGMDAVEIVLRAEELFGIAIADDEAASISRVRQFYELICGKLNVVPFASPVTPAELPVISEEKWRFLFLSKRDAFPAPAEVLPWSPQSVWDTVVALLVDQLQVRPEEVKPEALFAEDLGVD